MGWDNRVFNVNGRGVEMLERVLYLASEQASGGAGENFACCMTTDAGLVWMWCEGGKQCTQFPVALSAKQAAEMSFKWLASKEAKAIACNGVDANAEHDGHNSLGWRVHIGSRHGEGPHDPNPGGYATIAVVRPAYLWHGK